MSKKRRIISVTAFVLIVAALLTGILLTADPSAEKESIKEVMKDAVLHETGKISLFGIINVNPGLISAFIVSAVLIIAAIILRIFVIPKFSMRPGKLQYGIEKVVGLFTGISNTNSPHRPVFIGGYIFAAGTYIFVSTMFELLGIQAVTVNGTPVSLPAPLSDINGAIAMGVMSYSVILLGGLICNGPKGMFHALKDFSLPISMSFRLFGALLSGALVTELVYHYTLTSFVLPVIVAVLFTILHAFIQAYVLITLVSIFYGESTEKSENEKRKNHE